MKRRFEPFVPMIAGLLSLIYFALCILDSGLETSGIWVWPLFSAICFALSAGLLALSAKKKSWKEYGSAKLFAGCAAVLFALFFVFEAGVLLHMNETGEPGADYVIVLGSGVVGRTPSPPLMDRILTAERYLAENPEAIVIAAGGLANGENISEAECIYEQLVLLGVDPERILLEDQSTSTIENLVYCSKLAAPEASVCIVTSNFHMFRAMIYAKCAGFSRVSGLAAPFGGCMILHYMVREFMTITADLFMGNIP